MSYWINNLFSEDDKATSKTTFPGQLPAPVLPDPPGPIGRTVSRLSVECKKLHFKQIKPNLKAQVGKPEIAAFKARNCFIKMPAVPRTQTSKHLLLFCWKAFEQDTETLPVSWTLFIWPCDLCCLKKGDSFFSLLNPLTPLVYMGDNHALDFGDSSHNALWDVLMDSVSYIAGLSMSYVVLLVKFTLAISDFFMF